MNITILSMLIVVILVSVESTSIHTNILKGELGKLFPREACGLVISNSTIQHQNRTRFVHMTDKQTRTIDLWEHDSSEMGEVNLFLVDGCLTGALGTLEKKPMIINIHKMLNYFILAPIIVISSLYILFRMVIRKKLALVKSDRLNIKKTGIVMNEGSESEIVVTWLSLLYLLCCITPARSLVCLEPHKALTKLNNSSEFFFTLSEGEAACFDKGYVLAKPVTDHYSTAYMYTTSAWVEEIFKKKDCGGSDTCGDALYCNNMNQVNTLGSNNHTAWQTTCTIHERSIFKCISSWGCWKMHKTVILVREPLHVSKLKTKIRESEIETEGLGDCKILVEPSSEENLVGQYLVRSRDDSFLCGFASEVNRMVPGALGDLQISTAGEVLYSFESWKCNDRQSESSADCEHIPSFIGENLNKECLKLPIMIGNNSVVDNGLHIESSGVYSLNVQLSCKNVTLTISDHDCYDKTAKMEGVIGGLQMLSWRAMSKHLNSTWVVKSECLSLEYSVPCDGKFYSIAGLSGDLDHHCSYSGVSVENKLVSPPPNSYVWVNSNDDPQVHENHKHLSIAGVCCLVLAAYIIVRK
jgi:hypothetical protein